MTVIGVVGYGVVGRAVSHGFIDRGFKVYVNEVHEVALPKHNYSKKYLLEQCDVIFICVPTPSMPNGSINLGYVIHVINEFHDLIRYQTDCDTSPIFIIKSTVVPCTTLHLQHKYPCFKFAVNPEFLRAQSASKDFLYPDRVVIGAVEDDVGDEVAQLYASWSCPVIITMPTTAELIKYLSNAYLVSKVAFACEMQRLCIHYKVDMHKVYRGITDDERIHFSHLNPHQGKIPSNSHCLPKDLHALIKDLEEDGVNASYLQAVFDQGVQR